MTLISQIQSRDRAQEQPKEPLNQPPPVGVEEEGAESEGEGQGDERVQEEGRGESGRGANGGNENYQAEEIEVDLHAQDCRFSEADTEEKLGPHVALEKSYQQQSKQYLTVIEQEYNSLVALRSEIDNLLSGFKQRLRLPEETKLNTCFKNLRDLIGLYDTLELNETEMQIVIDPKVNEDAVEAVSKFNMMLEKCSEFQEKQQTSKQIMEENLLALENEGTQTQASLDAIERAKSQLKLVHEWNADVKHIVFDTKTSSKQLASRIVTGLLKTLEDC